MPSTLVLKKTVEYSPENQYLSEVIMIEKDNEAPQIAFSVKINPKGDGLECSVHHHSKNGIATLRELGYSKLSGPYIPDNSDISTLNPELMYLRQLYLAEGWLLSDKMWHHRYVTEEQANRVHQEIITMQKLESLSEDVQRFEGENIRYAILDVLRLYDFRFDLRRLRHPGTENIYISPVAPSTERLLICANYAHRNHAASIAVLLHLLCQQRSDEFTGERQYGQPMIEAVLFDAAGGGEGAYAYLQTLREAERKTIMGVIHLELYGFGDLLMSSPKESGNGKLLSAISFAAKQNKVTIQHDIVSSLTETFEREAIPFITIRSLAVPKQQAGKENPETLQNALHLLRDILRMFSFVTGDEVQEIPDMSSVQKMPKLNLLSLGNGKK